LKCCLNYELDTYMDALEEFPKKVDALYTQAGKAVLVKTDIFKRTMYFAYIAENGFRGQFYPLKLERVKEVLAMNKRGEKPAELVEKEYGSLGTGSGDENEAVFGGEELTGIVELPPEKRRKKSRNRNKNKRKGQGGRGNQNRPKGGGQNKDGKNSNSAKPQQKSKPKSKPQQKGGQKGKSQKNSGNQQKGDHKGTPQQQKDGQSNKPKKKGKWFNRKKKGKKPNNGSNNNNTKKD